MHLTNPAGVAIQIPGGMALIFGLSTLVSASGFGLVWLVVVFMLGGLALLLWGRQPAIEK